jgi:hypothetical protein
MEYVPYDCIKRILFYISVPQIMKICQSQIYVYNLCEDDNFWLEYLEVNYKNVPFDVLKYIRNSYAGYKQITMQMYDGRIFPLPDGILIPVFKLNHIILGYTIIEFNKTLTDLFLQIEREIANLDISTMWLNGQNWTIYVSKMSPSGHCAYSYIPEYKVIEIKAECVVNDRFRYSIDTDVSINSIQSVDVGAITSITTLI